MSKRHKKQSSKRRTKFENRKGLNLPKDFEFLVFEALLKDLGGDLHTDYSETLITDFSSDPKLKGVRNALRHRDKGMLREAVSLWQPQCMLSDGYRASDFFARYQLGSFLKKYPEKGSDSKQAAVSKFLDTEHSCQLFNEVNYRGLLALDKRHPEFLGVVIEIQNDILGLLGDFPNVERMFQLAKHGPGTSLLSDLYKRGQTTGFFKWSKLPYTVTSECIPYAKQAILDDPRWIGALDDEYRRSKQIKIGAPIDMRSFWDFVFVVVDRSRTTTVPKSAEIDRTICIEPLFNVYLQLGIDGIIRSRLKARWQYDLDNQEDNQVLAKEGSITDDFCTIDLSSASDLVTLKVCEMFLPPAWYALLLDLRSAATEIDGQNVPLAKISSMGNGYTFALESLIFGALTRCAIRRTKSTRISSVYGDDIVLPSTAYEYLKDLLEYSGFRLNREKSFIQGPFRESCGKDFFEGTLVRPVFLKKEITDVSDLFYLHNTFWALAEDLDWTFGYDFAAVRGLIQKYLPHITRHCFGPRSESLDTYLFSKRKLKRKSGGYSIGYRLIPKPRKYKKRYKDYFFCKLMCNLSGIKRVDHRWDLKRMPNTGNAFDITKRDKVTYYITECKVWAHRAPITQR